MANLLSGNKIKLNNGKTVNAQNGAWYDGRRFLNGQLLSPGEYEPGKFTSAEVNKQSSVAQGKAPDAIEKYLTEQRGGSAAGSSGSSAASTTQSPLQQVNKSIQDSFQKLQNDVIKRFGEYRGGKPFRVDEVLAEKSKTAAEQIDPYYNQILGDYLLGVTRKINRGVDDTRDLLSELTASTASYTKEAQNTLSEAVDKAQQGFADSGLFGSGEALKTEGMAKQRTGDVLTDYTRKAGLKEKQLTTGLNRNLEDIGAEKKSYVSNLERSRFTDVQQRAGTLTKEAGQQYLAGFQATLPQELQSASGFDFLKTLGIYS